MTIAWAILPDVRYIDLTAPDIEWPRVIGDRQRGEMAARRLSTSTLKEAKPDDLPVIQPTKFELVRQHRMSIISSRGRGSVSCRYRRRSSLLILQAGERRLKCPILLLPRNWRSGQPRRQPLRPSNSRCCDLHSPSPLLVYPMSLVLSRAWRRRSVGRSMS